jgi:hypothetical protein
VTVNGIRFESAFSFYEDAISLQNTCDGTLIATATAPVRYRHTMTVPTGVEKEERVGDDACWLEIKSGTTEFELSGNRLLTTFQGQTISFEPVNGASGLYGAWTAEIPGVGTLTWRMGGGKIVATVECDSGLSVSAAVDADFVNLLDITAGDQDVVTDDFGLECEASIAPGTLEYFFRGGDLVMLSDGEEAILTRR